MPSPSDLVGSWQVSTLPRRASTWVALAALILVGCSRSSPSAPPRKGRIVVAFTIDWEGAYLSPEGLDALDQLRLKLGAAPITHFVSAAYFSKESPDPTTLA